MQEEGSHDDRERREKRVFELCELALETPADERSPLLLSLCQDDAELLADVQAMLARVENTGHNALFSASNRDPLNLLGGASDQVGVDDRVGGFVLLEQIGSGGMGAVFRAERADHSDAQQVAIKVLNAQIVTPELRLRFDIERDILSRLRHPYISGLVDGGTTANGVPYLAMELVEGVRIDEYCDKNRLRIAQRLALLEKVAHALQYAHQNLIVHRDIKPSNILITADGIPKLVDFGIAKLISGPATDESEGAQPYAAPHGVTTYFGNQALTPDFASPEQLLEGKVSTASDIYSLGILAALLLTGRRPYKFDITSPKAVVAAFNSTNSWRASGLISQIRNKTDLAAIALSRGTTAAKIRRRFQGDLDTVLAKATHAEPQRRYVSAAAFAQDLANHRSGKAVSARADSLSYRTWSLIRSNRLTFSVVGATVVALSVGLTAALWQAEIANNRLNDLHQFSSVVIGDIYDSVANLPGSTPTRRLIAQEAQYYLDKLASEELDDVALLADLAVAYRRVADVQGRPTSANLGQPDLALANYTKAQLVAEKIDQETSVMRRERAQIYRRKGELLAWQGGVDEAINLLQRSLTMLQRLHEAQPESAVARVDYAYNLINLGDRSGHPGYQNVDDAAAAIDYYESAVRLLESVAGESTDRELLRCYSVALERMGTMRLLAEDLATAQSHFEASRDIRLRLAADHPRHMNIQRDAGVAMEQIAKVRLRRKDLQGAIADFESALGVYSRLYALDPEDASAKRTAAIGRENLGAAFVQAGDKVAAEEQFRRAEQMLLELLVSDPTAPRLLEKLGDVQTKLTDLGVAVRRTDS